MAIVGREKPRPFWTNKPLYPLKDCRCGATQKDHDVYTIYVGVDRGFWVVKCGRCGYMVCGDTQKEATRRFS